MVLERAICSKTQRFARPGTFLVPERAMFGTRSQFARSSTIGTAQTPASFVARPQNRGRARLSGKRSNRSSGTRSQAAA